MKKLVLLSLLITPLLLQPKVGMAQDIAEQPCDPNFWRQLTARAWLETEREIMQNQNLIFKPDSVLEYTCFDKFVNVANKAGGDIFVHTKYFGKEIITRAMAEGMTKALTAVVSSALSSYQNNAFGHAFLGDRAGKMKATPPDVTLSGTAKEDASYQCNIMANIWHTAKCANFVDNSEFQLQDGFYPFEAIKSPDGKQVAGYSDTIKEVRKQLGECAGPVTPNGNTAAVGPSQDASKSGAPTKGTWTDQLKLAENKDSSLYEFQKPLNKVFEDVNKKLKPGSCTEAIKTGVKVFVKGEDTGIEDGVCTNPGCSYIDGSCQ